MALDLPHSQFFHIQKTGGTWVRKAIKQARIPVNEIGNAEYHHCKELRLLSAFFYHARPSQIVGHDKFRFAFVRNPLTWYRSMYSNLARDKWERQQFPRADSFAEFMEWMLRERPGHVSKLYRSYNSVDYFGRFETLADDLVTALCMAGETFDEALLRATPVQNPASSLPEWQDKCVYTEDLRRRVVESEDDAFTRFNFDPHAVEVTVMS